MTDENNLRLLQAYHAAWGEYFSFVRADPELLAQTDEGKRLRAAADEAWEAYYNAAYKTSHEHTSSH